MATCLMHWMRMKVMRQTFGIQTNEKELAKSVYCYTFGEW